MTPIADSCGVPYRSTYYILTVYHYSLDSVLCTVAYTVHCTVTPIADMPPVGVPYRSTYYILTVHHYSLESVLCTVAYTVTPQLTGPHQLWGGGGEAYICLGPIIVALYVLRLGYRLLQLAYPQPTAMSLIKLQRKCSLLFPVSLCIQ